MALARLISAFELGLVLALSAASASAEGGPIRGGDHVGFTRIVLVVDPKTEWSIETAEGARTLLRFPGRHLAFDTRPVFDRIGRSRVADVRSTYDESGTTVSLEIACDCTVSTAVVGGVYLAVDVTEAVKSPTVELSAQRTEREKEAVADAEQALTLQIRRAAGQGLVELTNRALPTDVDPNHRKKVTSPAKAAHARGQGSHLAESRRLGEFGHDQIEATTVFDRDAHSTDDTRSTFVPDICVSDDRFNVDAWSNGLSVAVQIGALRNGLIGEFDLPNPANIEALSKLYIRFGFGIEAEALLAAFPDASIDERPLLIGLARAVENRPQERSSLLAAAEVCPGRHGLWLALGRTNVPFHDAGWFETVLTAFAELPPDLRRLLAPELVRRLINAGHPVEARKVQDSAERLGTALTAEQEIASAQLLAAEGSYDDAVRVLTNHAFSASPVSMDALTNLVQIDLSADRDVSDAIVMELEIAAIEARGSEREIQVRGLLAEARAHRGEILSALEELGSAIADLPETTLHFSALASQLLAEADPEETGRAAYAEAALRFATLITDTSSRGRIAGHLLEIGLPGPAITILADSDSDAPARLIAARAKLRLDRPEAARNLLADRHDSIAADVRARSFAQELAFEEALAALPAHSDLTTDYAWAAGNWDATSVASVADPDTPHAVMANYMRNRNAVDIDNELDLNGSQDLVDLTPEAAFLAPIPPLDHASLLAARRLIGTAPAIEEYIVGVVRALPHDIANYVTATSTTSSPSPP